VRARHLPLLAIVATLALAACGSSDDTTSVASTPAPVTDGEPTADPPVTPQATTPTSQTGSPSASSPTTGAPAAGGESVVVPAALDFTAPLVGGGQIEMGSLAGKPVVLWFWAPF
jgi:hypothetical protein